MKLFEINLTNVPDDADPEMTAALKVFIEDVYNQGGNAGFWMGFGFATTIAVSGLTAHLVSKYIEKRKEIRNNEE